MEVFLFNKYGLVLSCLIVFVYGMWKLNISDVNKREMFDPSVRGVLQQDGKSTCKNETGRNEYTVLSPTEVITRHYKGILGSLGVDVSQDAVSKTPERAANAMQYFTSGYNMSLKEIVNGAIFTETVDSIVVVKDIQMFSLCEHHLLPFMGKVTIGYQPRNTILGLSKFARIVDMFSRRLQVQERLTRQIAEAVVTILEPEGVGVIIEATHLCMVMRGVHQINSKTTTSYLLGSFKDDGQTRQEFLHAAGT